MDIFVDFRTQLDALLSALVAEGKLPSEIKDGVARVTIEPPRDASHGDISTNAAMVLSKPAKMKPRDLAQMLLDGMADWAMLSDVSIAGPGFINASLKMETLQGLIPAINSLAGDYGKQDVGAGKKVNVEYVSANPTGPMHMGHCRGAVFGDALADLLDYAGFDVTREYYINDAGSQIDTLARSAHLRYREALGDDIGEIPEGLYPGDYLVPVGKALADKHGDQFKDLPEADWLDFFKRKASGMMMDLIRSDLALLGIHHECFFSERTLHENGGIDRALAALSEKGHLYEGVLEPPKGKKPDEWEPRPQTLFKAAAFGDDIDRPLKKSDGTYTYFAADVAYHFDKIQRGYTQMIDVWGADHGGYVKRVQAAIKALAGDDARLDVRLCQMVRLFRDGEPVKMSKRSGTFVTLAEMVEEVGKDVVRFMMLTRKNDAQLDFDFAKVLEQSRENPVFYVQYAHARICSVERRAFEEFGEFDVATADVSVLDTPVERDLILMLAQWPRQIAAAAQASEPHRVAFYLYDLAALLHSSWNKGNDDPAQRFIVHDNKETTIARIALLFATRQVIVNGLRLLGVTPVEEMR